MKTPIPILHRDERVIVVLEPPGLRVVHESTPIQPLEPDRPGHRDTLVITLRAGGFQGPGA